MAHHGMLRSYQFCNSTEDVRGSKLYGLNDEGKQDEKLGKINDVIFDYATGEITYVVVDTGGWLSSKKFVVPAEQLRTSLDHEDDFTVNLSKRQIESFPPYDEGDLESDAKWADYEGRYRSKWEDGPVMHRAQSDHNVTPTPEELPGRGATVLDWSAAPKVDDSTTELAPTTRVVPAGTDSVVISNGPNGIGGRWDTFQSRLRERRKEVIGTGSAERQGAESVDTLPKAV